jgi:hypothetical protein
MSRRIVNSVLVSAVVLGASLCGLSEAQAARFYISYGAAVGVPAYYGPVVPAAPVVGVPVPAYVAPTAYTVYSPVVAAPAPIVAAPAPVVVAPVVTRERVTIGPLGAAHVRAQTITPVGSYRYHTRAGLLGARRVNVRVSGW